MSKFVPMVIEPGDLPHMPTTESREFVAKLVACGLDEMQIAFVMKITPLEVKQHYDQELTHGGALINAKVGAALLNNALKGDTVAQKFWLQTRARWIIPLKEDPLKDDAKGKALEDRRRAMDVIVDMVAKAKAKEEAAVVTQRATPGSKRVQ